MGRCYHRIVKKVILRCVLKKSRKNTSGKSMLKGILITLGFLLVLLFIFIFSNHDSISTLNSLF